MGNHPKSSERRTVAARMFPRSRTHDSTQATKRVPFAFITSENALTCLRVQAVIATLRLLLVMVS
jgi:hypothetical protein